MKFIPHDYQKFCIDYIKAHPISALLLDMGLGKTVITLTAIRDLMLDDLLVSKTLVIGPLRVARDTWPAEVEKWEHLQDLDVSVIVGDVKARTAALNHNALVYVINRENVKGRKSNGNSQWFISYPRYPQKCHIRQCVQFLYGNFRSRKKRKRTVCHADDSGIRLCAHPVGVHKLRYLSSLKGCMPHMILTNHLPDFQEVDC